MMRKRLALLVGLLCGCHGSPAGGPLPASPQHVAVQRDVAPLAAGGFSFASIGPYPLQFFGASASGKVNAYAKDPKNGRIIYLASGRGTGLETYSSAGLYRTSDGGASWQPVMNGLTDASGSISSVVNALWLDPSSPSVLVAATEYDGLFRTTDGGSSWHNVDRTTGATQIQEFNDALYAATASGILVSHDDGESWSVSFTGNSQRHPSALNGVDGSSGRALFAGMSDGSIYALSGGSWEHVGDLPFHKTQTAGSSPEVHQIAVDPLRPSTLYASENDGLWNQDLFTSTDSGHTWKEVLKKKHEYADFGLGTQAIAYSAVLPHMLYLGVDGGLLLMQGDGSTMPEIGPASNLEVVDIRDVWVSRNGKDDACWIASDQGLDYEPTCSKYVQGQYNDDVVSRTVGLALARHFTVSADGNTVLLSLQDFNESELTRDGGKDWSAPKGAYLYEDGFNELRPGKPNVCYAYNEFGLHVSNDGCLKFARPHGDQRSIGSSRVMTAPMAFDPKSPETMYFTSRSPFKLLGYHGRQGIFKTTDGGSTITQLAWPFAQPGCVVVDPHDGAHIVVSDLRNSRSSLSVTFDGGKSWRTASGVPATAFWYTATISPSSR